MRADSTAAQTGKLLNKEALESAHREFHNAVYSELKKLQDKGVKRSMAVLLLLKRIAGEFVSPEKEDVVKVVQKFQISKEDAIRALIVKEELVRLKKEGRDSLAAVKILTNKMKLSSENEDDVQFTLKNENSRKRSIVDDKSISSLVLKRLRRIAMKDSSSINERSLSPPNNSSNHSLSEDKEEKQVEESKSNSSQANAKLGRKRSILKSSPQGAGFSPSKRSRKSK